MPADCRIERTTYWCLPGTLGTIWSKRWWFSRKNCYGRWNLGPLPPAGNQESEQGMAPYLLTKTEKIPHTTICGKGYADSLLEWTRGNFGALHAQGEHCEQCNVCRSPEESPASCNQVQTMWTSEYRCFAPTWQCLAPYCLFNCCNNPRSVLWVSSTSALLVKPWSQWLSCLWTAQRGNEKQVFQVRQRGSAGGAQVVALSAKEFFSRGIRALLKCWNTCTEHNGDYIEKWSHCIPFVFNKLRDKKYLRFSFDSPSYNMRRTALGIGLV